MVEMRKKLDALTIDDVVFDPYLKFDEDGDDEVDDRVFSNVATYTGPLFHTTGFVILDPRRTLRQIGIVQKILPEDSRFKLSVANSQFKDKDVRLTYEEASLIEHWNARSQEVNQMSRRALEASHGTSEAGANYMEWYQEWAHPYVENLDPEALRHFKNAEKESTKSKASMNEEDDWEKMVVERVNWVVKDITRMINSGEDLMVHEQRLLRNRFKGITIPEKGVLYAYEEDRPRRAKRSRSPSSSDDSDTPSHPPPPASKFNLSKENRGGRGEKGGRGRGAKGGCAGTSAKSGRAGTSA
ncbi:uncharacterized protein LOC113307954 [Papaver somniferum]|uniref:uncharacterized protein LOC113307954 n=1 Tax=Papaver somniferum TaxID=3469 RepID=UPI000E6F78DE|nr:uncharacterized protein LOC113307954 [Papaver somniferum]XP_026412212.1 uncharacterized protein LOC113307954 [Papaver somniferum]